MPVTDPRPWGRPEPEERSRAYFTTQDVESDIRRLCSMLDGKIDEHGEASMRSARADVAYKNAHERALLVAEGSNAEQREAWAHSQVEAEYLERKIADRMEHAIEEAARNIRAQLSALQSIAATQRALAS